MDVVSFVNSILVALNLVFIRLIIKAYLDISRKIVSECKSVSYGERT